MKRNDELAPASPHARRWAVAQEGRARESARACGGAGVAESSLLRPLFTLQGSP
jgi:poly-gamma-glutamate capsule biosynthesis protein CapA/YwtB (metallophosphatase superfamily)